MILLWNLTSSKFSLLPTKENDKRTTPRYTVKALLITHPNKLPSVSYKVIISTPLSRKENYIYELEMHKKSACEQ